MNIHCRRRSWPLSDKSSDSAILFPIFDTNARIKIAEHMHKAQDHQDINISSSQLKFRNLPLGRERTTNVQISCEKGDITWRKVEGRDVLGFSKIEKEKPISITDAIKENHCFKDDSIYIDIPMLLKIKHGPLIQKRITYYEDKRRKILF